MTELFRALATIAELPAQPSADLCALLEIERAPTAVESTDFFVFQQVPYASVYLAADGMLGGEPRDRIAGFWRAIGCVPPEEADHLSAMLGAYADVCERHEAEDDPQQRERWGRVRRVFLWEHLLSWLPVYLLKAEASAPEPLAQWAILLSAGLRQESQGHCQPDALPAHLREVPALVDPRTQPGEFVGALLSPARCGFILTRRDLTGAALALGTTCTVTGRRQLLATLLEQEPAGALAWLVAHAGMWEQEHERGAFGAITEFWRARAAASRALLHTLEQELAGGRLQGVT